MAVSVPEMFEHVGPWSEEEFLAPPVDRRVELLDGALLVSSNARFRHQRLSSQLWAALGAAAPMGMEVLEAINVRVGPGKILIPDLAVVTVPGLDLVVCDASDLVMVVEITSPGNALFDRAVKPQLYAQAGVRHYLRIEQGEAGPSAAVYQLKRDRYVEVTRVDPGRPLTLIEPFAVTVDLTALAKATRPPGHRPSE